MYTAYSPAGVISQPQQLSTLLGTRVLDFSPFSILNQSQNGRNGIPIPIHNEKEMSQNRNPDEDQKSIK
jgi:hypothetical protein